MTKNQAEIMIYPYLDTVMSYALIADLDSIFYASSGTRTFASDAVRAQFRERWLGNYLTNCGDEAFLALTDNGNVAGYLVGELDDPACNPRYADLGYFVDFAPHTPLYPAHLHINVATQYRSLGLGQRLVEAFAGHARSGGAPGMHIVTGKGMRNVGFYLRCGFQVVAEAPWNGREVVMMGRRLAE